MWFHIICQYDESLSDDPHNQRKHTNFDVLVKADSIEEAEKKLFNTDLKEYGTHSIRTDLIRPAEVQGDSQIKKKVKSPLSPNIAVFKDNKVYRKQANEDAEWDTE